MPFHPDEQPEVQPEVAAVEVVEVETVDLPSLSTRIKWYEEWEESTRTGQKEARLDRDYYDNKQWTKQDAQTVRDRKQPVITKNRIARKVNTVLGEEIRKRIDPVAFPRTQDHTDSAKVATDALRFVEEEQKFDDVRSAVFKNMLIEGYGGAYKNITQDEDGDYKHELIHVEWDRLFYDPRSRSPDFSDAKYLGIVVWKDVDDAKLDYPDFAAELQSAVNTNRQGGLTQTMEDTPRQWMDETRQRVKIVEMYFRIGQDWYRSDFTEGLDLEKPDRTYLQDEKRRHTLCPLNMVSCYVDQDGIRYGVVRQLRSPQDEINKRSSKALHQINVKQVVAERDAIVDPDKFMSQLAKPDGFAEVEPGRMADGSVQIVDGMQLAAAHVQLLQEAKAEIDSIGPSSSNIPDLPETASGRAIIARQQAASQEMGPAFDNLRKWTRRQFEYDWLCVRLFWTEEMWLRVTDDNELSGYRFVSINRPLTRAERFQELMEEEKGLDPAKALKISAGNFAKRIASDTQAVLQQQAQQIQQLQQEAQQLGIQPPQVSQPDPQQVMLSHPLMQEQITLNQVDQMLVDIIMSEVPDTATVEEEEFDKISAVMQPVIAARPELGPFFMELLVQMSSLRDKNDILEKMREPPDPKEQEAKQAQIQAQMQEMAAQIQVLQSAAQLNQAKAAKAGADAQVVTAKVESEISENEANAMKLSADAGVTAAGAGG